MPMTSRSRSPRRRAAALLLASALASPIGMMPAAAQTVAATAAPSEQEIAARVKSLLGELTLEEKVSLLAGGSRIAG